MALNEPFVDSLQVPFGVVFQTLADNAVDCMSTVVLQNLD